MKWVLKRKDAYSKADLFYNQRLGLSDIYVLIFIYLFSGQGNHNSTAMAAAAAAASAAAATGSSAAAFFGQYPAAALFTDPARSSHLDWHLHSASLQNAHGKNILL